MCVGRGIQVEQIIKVLPDTISEKILSLSPSMLKQLEEIRIRVERPLEVFMKGKPYYPDEYHVTKEDGVTLLNQLSQYSLYTIEEELQKGYITIQGGHRVGLAGKVITEKGRVKAIRDITSYNIRIARQKIGVANPLIPFIYQSKWLNTMIIGPPQTGKTTLLRDISRIISTGNNNLSSSKVGIVDERSEIAGCVKGIPQHNLGPRIDVLDACPKAEGMMMLIRSMSPDVLVVDEIGRMEDVEAIKEAINAGVALFVTVHGNSLDELYQRPSIQPLLEMCVFERFIELTRKEKKPGSIKRICNSQGQDLLFKVSVK